MYVEYIFSGLFIRDEIHRLFNPFAYIK